MEYVRENIRIAAPVGRVWAFVAGFGAMEPWCPAIKSMELEGHGIGSVRVAYLEGGIVSREQLLEVDTDNYRIVYSLMPPSALPLQNIRSTMQLFAIEPNLTEVLWYSEADPVPDDIQANVGAVVGGFYRECLTELKVLTERERVVRKLM
ncbi:MAG: SRPBCC family protein [Porticoccaceae bacterium]